jgi:excisionase family DNA binding protein
MTSTTAHRQIVLTIEEAADSLRIGRTLMYALVMAGEVESVQIGRLRRIPIDALDQYVERLRMSRQGSR